MGGTFVEEVNDYFEFIEKLEKYNNKIDSNTIVFHLERKEGYNAKDQLIQF